jgi:NADH-quinone oxidoreductase subunit H
LQAAEFGAVLVNSAIIANLFLGGWSGPFLSGQLGALWFLLKTLLFVFLFMWLRATLPRLRVDQIMAFAWKVLFPMSLINLFAVAIEVYFFRDPLTGVISTAQLWLMAVINAIIAIGTISLFGRALRERVTPPHRVQQVPLPGMATGEAR